MTATTVSNAMPRRKQLSDQLDRLDSILDALSDGLNGAVIEPLTATAEATARLLRLNDAERIAERAVLQGLARYSQASSSG